MTQDYFALCQGMLRAQAQVRKELAKQELKGRWYPMSAQEIREELESKGFNVTADDIRECGPETPQQIEQWLNQ